MSTNWLRYIVLYLVVSRLTAAFNLQHSVKPLLLSQPHFTRQNSQNGRKASPPPILGMTDSSTSRNEFPKTNASIPTVKNMIRAMIVATLRKPFSLFSRMLSINHLKSLLDFVAFQQQATKQDTEGVKETDDLDGDFIGAKCKVGTEFSERGVVDEIAASGLASPCPVGGRWAVAAETIDFSGNWQVLVDEQFKVDYDRYLAKLDQPLIVRTVAVGIVGRTTEELRMTDKGRRLFIRGVNARGVWDRELITSGTDVRNSTFDPLHVSILVRISSFRYSRPQTCSCSRNLLYSSDC